MQKNTFKKIIALTYLLIFIFGLFLPFNKSFAEDPSSTNRLVVTAEPSTIKQDENTKITAKVYTAVGEEKVYFSITGILGSFTGGVHNGPKNGDCIIPAVEQRPKGYITLPKVESCNINFKTGSIGSIEMKVTATTTENGGGIYSSTVLLKVCKSSENIINGICVDPTTVKPEPKINTDTTYTPLAPLPGLPGTPFDTLPSDTNPCPFGNYLNIIIKLIIGMSAVLAMVMITMGGVEYMSSELVSGKEAGKETIRNAIFGLLIALSAYLILNTINPQLLSACLDNLPKAEITIVPLADGSYSSTGGMGGSCTVPTDPKNACIPKTLANTCFANRATEASKICNVESGNGNSNAESGSDLLNNGTGPSYSIGLWQVNLTVHQVGGLNCPAAFSGPCGKGTATPSNTGPFVGGPKVGNCSQKVINQTLYNQCVAAAKDTTKNTAAACNLYTKNGSSFKPWSYTANKCSIPI